jgi:hypothetical protein
MLSRALCLDANDYWDELGRIDEASMRVVCGPSTSTPLNIRGTPKRYQFVNHRFLQFWVLTLGKITMRSETPLKSTLGLILYDKR